MNGSEGTTRGRTEDDLGTRLRENAVGIASMLVTGIWLAGLLTGQSWWLPVLIVGYAAVIPIVATLSGNEDDRREWADEYTTAETSGESAADTPDTDARDALETLRERYAAGKLTDDQFERKLERLLETGTLEDADEWVRDRERGHDRDRGTDGESDLEYER